MAVYRVTHDFSDLSLFNSSMRSAGHCEVEYSDDYGGFAIREVYVSADPEPFQNRVSNGFVLTAGDLWLAHVAAIEMQEADAIEQRIGDDMRSAA